MGLYQRYVDCFTDYDEETFKSIHHEDFIFLRETEMLTLDEHVEIITPLATKEDWNWHKVAKLLYEDNYVSLTRWEDGDDVITVTFYLKDDLCWRQLVNRVPK